VVMHEGVSPYIRSVCKFKIYCHVIFTTEAQAIGLTKMLQLLLSSSSIAD
jgi:hypothetical protein